MFQQVLDQQLATLANLETNVIKAQLRHNKSGLDTIGIRDSFSARISLCLGFVNSVGGSRKRPILSLEELDNNKLVAINPTGEDHQQKREPGSDVIPKISSGTV